MRRLLVALLIAASVATILAPSPVAAQQPADSSGATHILRTRDGSTVIGRLVDSTADSIRIETRGGSLAFAHSDVAELRSVKPAELRQGQYWPENPNTTRLFFAPTGRMLAPKEGYFSDTYLFFMNVAAGVTSRFTMGGGMSVLPTDDFSENLFYITPKVGLVQTEKVNVAAGVLAGIVGFDDEIENRTFGIAYGVATFGSANNSLTLGAGAPFAGGRFAESPVFMLGGETRAWRRASLVTENYVFSGGDEIHGIVSYGVRFLGERLSVDLAFFNIPGEDFIFPGIPYVGFAVKF